MSEGRIVILSGPSGVGKDTVIEAWRETNPRVQRVVAYTTRRPRPGETDGVDYHFVSRDLFQQYAEAGEFLEYKEVHGNYYATPLADLKRMVADGKVAILKIDVQGALAAMELLPEALSVFLLPPSGDELARRMRERGTEDHEAMSLRLRNAENEIRLADRYRYRVVNANIGDVVGELERIVGSPVDV